MSQHFVEVHTPEGPSRRHRLPSSHSSIGSGDDAAVQLPSLGGESKLKLVCDELPGGVYLRTEPPLGVPIRLGGTLHRAVFVPWREDVFVGALRLCFVREEGKGHTYASFVFLAISALSLIAGLASAARWNNPPSPSQAHAPPVLVDHSVPCPAVGARIQRQSAEEAVLVAHAKRDRFPFDPREGTAVLRYLARARACYVAAADSRKALEVSAEYQAWKAELELRSRSMLLALENDVADKRYAHAKRVGAALRAIHHEQPPNGFTGWLDELGRWLDAQVAGGA